MIRKSSNPSGLRNSVAAKRFAQTKFREGRNLPFSSLVHTRPVPWTAPRRTVRNGLDPAEFRPAVHLRDFRTSSFRRREAVT
jgi:hypothetical protein